MSKSEFNPDASSKEEQSITSADVGQVTDVLDDVAALAALTPEQLAAVGVEPVGKQSFKFVSGVIADPSKAGVGQEAPQAFQDSIAQERTDKPKDTRSAWQQKIDSIVQSGTQRQRYVITNMEGYLEHMAPNKQVSVETAVLRQKQLWRTLKNVVSIEDGFEDTMALMIEYFREYSKVGKALHGAYLHRFHSELDLSQDESRGLGQLTNIFTTAAGVVNRKDVLKHCALRQVELKGVDEIVRDRLFDYFNQG